MNTDPAGPHPNQVEVFEPTPRWVRAVFAGQAVASSRRAMLLRAPGGIPKYYFPAEDVMQSALHLSGRTRVDARYGPAALYTLTVGGRTAEDAAWTFTAPPAGVPPVTGWFAFDWHSMDAWFEEDEQVYVHARDPYKRVDVCHSSRRLQVFIDGHQVADSRRPCLLFETGLPTRYYLPRADVRTELLEPSRLQTQCPYKGLASYYSVRIGDKVYPDLVWYYPFPIPECPKIENLLAFFNEKVDILVDGEPQPRPQTAYS